MAINPTGLSLNYNNNYQLDTNTNRFSVGNAAGNRQETGLLNTFTGSTFQGSLGRIQEGEQSSGYTGLSGGNNGIANTAAYEQTTQANQSGSGGGYTGGSGDTSAAGSVGAVFSMVDMVITDMLNVSSAVGDYKWKNEQVREYNKSFAESQRRFDVTFKENVRQFGLEYSLKEFATRKGIKLQEAQFEWQKVVDQESIVNNRLTRDVTQYDFNEKKKKDASHQAFAEAFSRNLIKRLGVRKPAKRVV